MGVLAGAVDAQRENRWKQVARTADLDFPMSQKV